MVQKSPATQRYVSELVADPTPELTKPGTPSNEPQVSESSNNDYEKFVNSDTQEAKVVNENMCNLVHNNPCVNINIPCVSDDSVTVNPIVLNTKFPPPVGEAVKFDEDTNVMPSIVVVSQTENNMSPTLQEVVPALSESLLVHVCLLTEAADVDETANTEKADTNPAPGQESKVLKSLKCLTHGVVDVNSVFPIIAAISGNVTLNLLVDCGSETTLLTRDVVDRAGAPTFKGRKISMHGLGDKKASTGNEYATMKLTFEGKTFEVSGLIVESICSEINMSYPSVARDMTGVDLTMNFHGNKSANFKIDALIGLDIIAKVISHDDDEDVRMRKIDDLLLIKIGSKFLPFGSMINDGIYESPKKRYLLNISGQKGVRTAFLDILLQEFFKSENTSPPLQRTMQDEVNESYEIKFKESYTLVDNKNEPGAKRFCVIPHWKPAELRPTHVPEVTSKEALRRFLALERKLNSTKNKKLKSGYEESIHKNISYATKIWLL